VKDEDLFVEWIDKFGATSFILGADVKDEKITISGWLETTDIWIYDFIRKYLRHGLKQIFCTDVKKDGLLQGPSVKLYKNITAEFPSLHLIASGGVSSIKDLEELAAIGCNAAIVGKAIYENRISLKELKIFQAC
jgi:phosphoribosylformimino-5-aminoimidazole carboxamide ribotide isomerase